MQKLFLMPCLIFFVCVAHAQTKVTIVPKDAPFEWGKISQEDLDMKVYSLDSSADAVVLYNMGSFDVPRARASYFKHHKRIKFLKKSAFKEQGLVSIPYYLDRKDKFLSLRAQVIQPDGSIRIVEPSEILDETTSKYISHKKIVFPELREGSIAEVDYEIQSRDIYEIRDWFFQEEIPVRHCQFKTILPKTFGFFLGKIGNYPVKTIIDPKSDDYIDVRYFYADSIGSFNADKIVSSIEDYSTPAFYQINQYVYDDSTKKNTTVTWSEYATALLDKSSFGNFLHHVKCDDAWKDIKPKIDLISTPTGKMTAVFNFIKEKIKWNGEFSVQPSESLNKVYKEKKGDCADINILLVSLLNNAGLKAFPLLISSRMHGKSNGYYPVRDQFNYMACLVDFFDKQVLLDATDTVLQPDFIRLAALNNRAFVVDKQNPHWINIVPQAGIIQRSLNIELDKNFQISGTLTSSYKGYDACIERENNAEKEAFDRNVKNYFIAAGSEVQIEKNMDTHLKDFTESYKTTVNFKITDVANSAGEINYINPTLKLFDYYKNPFKQEKRTNPIDFPYPERKNFVSVLKIPDYYVAYDLPKSVKFSLPNDDIVFQYAIAVNENQIVCNLKLSVNRLHYGAEDYEALKKFFEQVAVKQDEQVVFKKK